MGLLDSVERREILSLDEILKRAQAVVAELEPKNPSTQSREGSRLLVAKAVVELVSELIMEGGR